MKKYILFVVLGISISCSLYAMEHSNPTHNDRIKLEVSAAYAPATIEIYKQLITCNNKYKNQSKAQNNSIDTDINILKHSINLMQNNPSCTYALLQAGSTLYAQLVLSYATQKALGFPPDTNKSKILECHQQLHNLYRDTSLEAYEQISTSYASQTQDLLVDLWHHTLTIFQKNLSFSYKVKCTAAQQLFTIADMFKKITENKTTTYKVLLCMQYMQKNCIFENNSDTSQEADYIRTHLALIKKFDPYYNEVTKPGMLQ